MRPITACVVNHQGVDRLDGVLSAIRASTRPVTEILVVDSGSTDGSLALLSHAHPDVRVIAMESNLGPADARNRGFDGAAHDRILFVDNDVRVEPGCLARLDDALEGHGDAVLAMPIVLDGADPSRIHFEGAEAHCLGQMIVRRSGESVTGTAGGVKAVGSMVSACFLVDRGRTGGIRFDPIFEFNYEDHDFGLRCRSAGMRLLVVPDARCLHGSGTPGHSVRLGVADPPDRLRRMVLARWLIVRRCYSPRTRILLAPALGLFEVVQWVWLARSGRLGSWRAARGHVRGLGAQIQATRVEVARRRRVRDGDLLVGGPLPIRASLTSGPLERWGVTALGSLASAWWRLVRSLA
jgi:GT2 family glycosyltransferase